MENLWLLHSMLTLRVVFYFTHTESLHMQALRPNGSSHLGSRGNMCKQYEDLSNPKPSMGLEQLHTFIVYPIYEP